MAEKVVPIDVIVREAEAYGVELDAKSFLTGFVIGRTPPAVLHDPERLAEMCQFYFGADGRRRKQPESEA